MKKIKIDKCKVDKKTLETIERIEQNQITIKKSFWSVVLVAVWCIFTYALYLAWEIVYNGLERFEHTPSLVADSNADGMLFILCLLLFIAYSTPITMGILHVWWGDEK